MSTEKDAILFTNGDNDTYPVWVLQNVHGIRDDVTVLNIPLLPTESYLERKLKKKGITIDYEELKRKAMTEKTGTSRGFSRDKFVQDVTKTLAEKYPDIPVYFALTVYPNYIESLNDDLYIVGLAFHYSEERIDNLALLKRNFEKNFRLDYLEYDWYTEHYGGRNLMNRIHMNYIAPIIMLAEHYKTSGEDGKAREWKDRLLKIVRKTGDKDATENIEKHLEEKCLQ